VLFQLTLKLCDPLLNSLISTGCLYLRIQISYAPSSILPKKNKEFYWDENCGKAFEKLKELMITGLVLAHFHEKRETILEANSSEYAIGGLLLKKDEKGW
jgi:hypothetical protein